LTTGQVDTAYASDVAVDGDVVIVGAPAEGNGRAHVYRYSASTWAVEDVLSDPSGVGWFINSPAFGHSVAVRGDLIAVGEPHATIDGKIQHGKALVFQRSGLEWIQETELLPPGGDYDWRFGVSVALSSERLVIGSPGATSLAGATSLSSALWSVWPSLGSAVAVDGPLVVAGNPMESLTGNAFQGSATVFSVMNPFWHYAGGGLAGVHGVPDLVGRGTFAPGSPTTLTLSDARPSAPVVVFLGFTPLYAPFKGGTLAPTPSLLLFGLSTDVSGGLTAGAPWPGGIPSGLTLWMHFWIQDPAGVFGWSAGNALSATQP
jgi:hypothetical protein